MSALLLIAAVELVAGGEARLRVETDGSEAAKFAAEVLRKHVVLMTGVALPATGTLPPLRFQSTRREGYAVRPEGSGVVVEGRDLARAAYDLLEAWGCRFETEHVPKREGLSIEAREWRPKRELWVERSEFDPSIAGTGVAIHGLASYLPERFRLAIRLGYPLRVCSESFDDFLPPSHFEEHPEWFALRQGERAARGNFALTNPAARSAYLDALGLWLEAHPEVAVTGIWPEVTTVWSEESLAIGAPAAYALLWREAAARFPGRKFEILATGLTLRPPEGRVPANVEVRLRPGREASGLQGIAGQEIEAVVRAWEVRGARVVLEIDAAPESWCGMPWPCHDAIRADAGRFGAAVLRGGGHLHARLWRFPDERRGDLALLDRARGVASWGHPRDAADLFFDESQGLAFRIAAVERLLRIAEKDSDPVAAADVFLGYRAILGSLEPRAARAYRRFRQRDVRRMTERLLPGGAERRLGPALLRETFDRVEVETDLLRLVVDRDQAAVISLQRKTRGAWGPSLCAAAFDVVALKVRAERAGGSVELSSPGAGLLRIDLRGKLRPGGPAWRSRLDLKSGSGIVQQTSEVECAGGIAVGCVWKESGSPFDRWVCPPHAMEGRSAEKAPTLPIPAGGLVYLRDGEEGLGLAARLTHGGSVTLKGGVVATRPGKTIMVDWIVFSLTSELGK